jgi:hypothetical protein
VQAVEEGDEGFLGDRPDRAPFALAQFRAADRVEEDLVEARLGQVFRGRIEARRHAQRQRLARFGMQRHEGHADVRVARLDLARQFQRRLGRAGGPGFHQVRVEHVVELVVPGDDRAGDAADEQEAGGEQAEVTVDQGPESAHGSLA